MGTFDLTSTQEPTDEQLQSLMDGIGEKGRKSTANKKKVLDKLFQETIEKVKKNKKV
jgi:hypothetical protein